MLLEVKKKKLGIEERPFLREPQTKLLTQPGHVKNFALANGVAKAWLQRYSLL